MPNVLTAKLLSMRTTLALTITCLLSISLLAQQPQAPRDTIIVPVAPMDSVETKTQGFEIRRPLTQQEEQRRADNRAEVEDMKSRFRQFHQEEQSAKESAAMRAEDANYIWSDAELGGQVQRKGTANEPTTQPANTEELRMEIGRNLQQGRKMDTPDRPVLPEYPNEPPAPASYDYPPPPRPTEEDWQSNIRSSLQTGSSDKSEQWQARVGTGAVGLVDPQSGLPLQAGQTILLHTVHFPESSATLTPVTQDALHQWAKVLHQYPGLIVQVRAHVNSKVPAFEAQQLTNQRAEAITLFWQEQGVAPQQLSYRGYGQLSPLVSSADPLALQKNERIEVVILEMP